MEENENTPQTEETKPETVIEKLQSVITEAVECQKFCQDMVKSYKPDDMSLKELKDWMSKENRLKLFIQNNQRSIKQEILELHK